MPERPRMPFPPGIGNRLVSPKFPLVAGSRTARVVVSSCFAAYGGITCRHVDYIDLVQLRVFPEEISTYVLLR